SLLEAVSHPHPATGAKMPFENHTRSFSRPAPKWLARRARRGPGAGTQRRPDRSDAPEWALTPGRQLASPRQDKVIRSAAVDKEVLFEALKHPLVETDFPRLGRKYRGKVRDCYTTARGERIIVVTDRISAFDRSLG